MNKFVIIYNHRTNNSFIKGAFLMETYSIGELSEKTQDKVIRAFRKREDYLDYDWRVARYTTIA